MMGFSVLWCVRKGQTQFACPCCSTYDFLQAMSSQSPTMSTMGPNYSFLVPSRLSGLLWMPGETTVLLCTPPKQLRQGIPFSPSPQSLSPSPLMQQVLQEVLPKPRAWGDAQGTQPHAGVQRGHQQHRQCGELGIDCVVTFAYCSLVANQQKGCPALHNACTANIINLIYHRGVRTAPVRREH